MNYKFTLFFLLLIIVTSQLSKAQETKKGWKKGGIGFTTAIQIGQIDRFGAYQTWAELNSFENNFRTTGAIGVFFVYNPIQRLRIQLELNYAGYGGQFRKKANVSYTAPVVNSGQYGNTSSSSIQQGYYQDIYRMNFLEFPLLARYYFFSKSFTRPYLETGMSYGLLASATNRYNSFSGSLFNTTQNWETNDIEEITENHFINYALGTGIDFFCNTTFTVGINLRFSNSLTRVFKYDLYDVRNGSSIERYDLVSHYHTFRIAFQGAYIFK